MRRITVLSAVVLVALASVIADGARAEDAPQLAVSKYGKVFSDADLTLQIVQITGSKGVLARFTGQPAEEETIDGRVMQYDGINAGSGLDYRGRGKGGVGVTRMSTRAPDGAKTIDVHFQGKTYTLKHDEKASKALETATLLNDYKATRDKPGP